MKLTDEKIGELWRETIASAAKSTCYDIQLRFARAILKAAGVEETERDAERYRWLRENLGKTVSHWLCTEGGEELDETLDAIMKAK